MNHKLLTSFWVELYGPLPQTPSATFPPLLPDTSPAQFWTDSEKYSYFACIRDWNPNPKTAKNTQIYSTNHQALATTTEQTNIFHNLKANDSSRNFKKKMQRPRKTYRICCIFCSSESSWSLLIHLGPRCNTICNDELSVPQKLSPFNNFWHMISENSQKTSPSHMQVKEEIQKICDTSNKP